MLPDFIQVGRTVITIDDYCGPNENVIESIENRYEGDHTVYYHDTSDTTSLCNGKVVYGPEIFESHETLNAEMARRNRLSKLMTAISDMTDDQRIELLEIIYEKFALDYR